VAKLPSQFNRAFDLSTLKPPQPVAAGQIIECNERIFVEQLIPLSKQKPVILVLWTPRSSDSVALVDGLAVLAQKPNAGWQLATVNADSEAAIVEALRATGVPMTVALIAGQIAPLFEGLIPPEQLTELLEKVVTLAQKQGVGSGNGTNSDGGTGAESDEEPEITAAYGALAVNDLIRAKAEFERLLARKPGESDALQGLANIELLQRITGHDGSEVMEQAERNPSDGALQRVAADFEFLAGNVAGAFSRLINLIQISVGEERESVRLQVLSLFAMLESDDPELIKARSALARALF
jgi:putative thioredoxin